MNFVSKTTHPSKTTEGVSFVLKKMNERRRIERELAIADVRGRLNEAGRAADEALKAFIEADRLAQNVPDTPRPPSGAFDQAKLDFDRVLRMEWYPAWIRWGLDSIEGFEIDGAKAGIEELLGEGGPDELLKEIFDQIIVESGLGPEKSGNSPPPGASGAQADGKTSDSTATNAEPPAGTKLAVATPAETAPSISPAT